MKIHLDIRQNISPTIVLECVRQVIAQAPVEEDIKNVMALTEQLLDGNL